MILIKNLIWKSFERVVKVKKNFLFYFRIIFILFIVFIFSFYNDTFAAYPKLVSRLINGFETIKEWIIKISTPAAAVAVRYWSFYEKI